jgi:cardiolipin synthase
VGSSNFDNRSFGLNDEVNVLLADEGFAEQLRMSFERDACSSERIDMATWQARPLPERMMALLGIVLERQQ